MLCPIRTPGVVSSALRNDGANAELTRLRKALEVGVGCDPVAPDLTVANEPHGTAVSAEARGDRSQHRQELLVPTPSRYPRTSAVTVVSARTDLTPRQRTRVDP